MHVLILGCVICACTHKQQRSYYHCTCVRIEKINCYWKWCQRRQRTKKGHKPKHNVSHSLDNTFASHVAWLWARNLLLTTYAQQTAPVDQNNTKCTTFVRIELTKLAPTRVRGVSIFIKTLPTYRQDGSYVWFTIFSNMFSFDVHPSGCLSLETLMPWTGRPSGPESGNPGI